MSKTSKSRSKPRAIFAKRYAYEDDAHPVALYLNTMSPASQRTMSSALESIADILSRGKTGRDQLAWHELKPTHVAALRNRMVRSLAPATTNCYLTAIRGVLKSAWRLDLIDRETFERATDVPPARGKRAVKGRTVSIDELRTVIQSICSAFI